MIFTLLVCFGILWIQDELRDGLLRGVATLCLILLTLNSDWPIFAPVFTLLFRWSYPSRRWTALAYGASILFFGANEVLVYSQVSENFLMGLLQAGLSCLGPIISAIIILFVYNGKRSQVGKSFFKWFFYIFYPAHLLLLWAISEGFPGLKP